MDTFKSIDSFLTECRIKRDTWEAAEIELDLVRAIVQDHASQVDRLTDSAELFAKVMQRIPCVHSVRWRIKDPLHLAEKIVRKRAEKSSKYLQISLENYFELVTDLVGVRALHLFKDDCFTIDASLCESWTPAETPIAYIRRGDSSTLTDRYSSCGFDVKDHPKGYRSIHYVFSNQPHQRKVFAEVQVRSLFEEGWSEIDHRIRYPNFSDSDVVEHFLTIFNRMAGSADEMGSFVRDLVAGLKLRDGLVEAANSERDSAMSAMVAMESTLAELDELKKQDASTQKLVKKLQTELAHLRQASAVAMAHSDDYMRRALGITASDVASGVSSAHALNTKLKFFRDTLGIDLSSLKSDADIARAIGVKRSNRPESGNE